MFLSIIIVVVGLSLLILVHEAGHFFTAKFFNLKIEEFGFGMPPRAIGKKIGETIYSLNWLPFGGFVKIYGEEGAGKTETGKTSSDAERSFYFQVPWKRAVIVVAGVVMNFVVGWLLLSAVFMIGSPDGVIITAVGDNSPAKIAGLEMGDRIMGFGNSSDAFAKYIDGAKGQEINLNVIKGGKETTVKITPRISPPEGEGPLGVTLDNGGQRDGFLEGLKDGFLASIYIIKMVFLGLGSLIAGLFHGNADLSGVVGPVGIFKIAIQAGGIGIVYLLQLVALISVNLAVINIMPFPALDGGRFLFIIIEKIKGSPLPQKFEQWANSIGFAFLLLLIFAITARDIVHLF